MSQQTRADQVRKGRVALLSVASNSTLVVLKLTVGLLIGSVSVMSEAIHSGVDLIASLVALFSVRTSGKPADEEHPFGHGKIENLSGAIEALLIFAAAGWIVYEAARKLIEPHPLEAVGWGIAVMLLSSVANLVVSQLLFKVGRETDSVALQADGWHLRTDVYTSAGVMAALALIALGDRLAPGVDLRWLDPVAGILVAMLIVRAAYRLTVSAGRDLIDRSLQPDEEEWIREHIGGLRPTVRGYHKLRTRKAGPVRFVEFHLFVDSTMSVAESHAVAEGVEKRIEERFPGSSVLVHVEPCDAVCGSVCLDDCLLTEGERRALREGGLPLR